MRARRWAGALVIVQLTLTPVLLMGGGLMLATLLAAYQTDPGINTDGLTRIRIALDEQTYPTTEHRRQFYDDLEQRLGAVPRLRAAIASIAPLEGAQLANWRSTAPVNGARRIGPPFRWWSPGSGISTRSAWPCVRGATSIMARGAPAMLRPSSTDR